MTMAGRPIRFVIGVVAGWTVLRIALLLPEVASIPGAIDTLLPSAAAEGTNLAIGRTARAVPWRTNAKRLRPLVAQARDAASTGQTSPQAMGVWPISTAPSDGADRNVAPAPEGQSVSIAVPGQRIAGLSRWSASAWVAIRGGGADRAIADGGQLGGSQAGVRLRYALDDGRTWSATARLSTPIEGIGREAAIGVEWRPAAMPVSIIAERRIALDQGRGGTALFAVGGFGPQPVGMGLEAEGYAQAGGVLRDAIEPFADGALRISRPFAIAPIGTLSVGAGVWGGAQRGAARLDVGPSLGVAIPAGKRAIRVALDWRQRVAGAARPGSGVALTLGSDF